MATVLSTDADSLLFEDKQKQGWLELGISLAVHSWGTLTTAVDSKWGGADSEDKRDWMAGVVVDSFDQNEIDAAYIEELLLNMMEDEFETSVEDGSAQPIAELIIKLYQQIAEGNRSGVDELHQKFKEDQEKRQAGIIKPQKASIRDEDGNEIAEDDEEDDEEEDDSNAQEEPQEKQGPIIDDDGFELVQRRKR